MNNPANLEQSLFVQATGLLRSARIVPMVTVETAEQGAAVAAALAEGGLNTIEITLRSRAALDAISAAKRAVPGMLVGAGTILDAGSGRAAIEAGADFLVTPGTTPALIEALLTSPVPCIPGASTISEMLQLAAFGFESLKLFPALSSGGITLLREMMGPLPNLRFFPVGGIDESNVASFLDMPNVVCVGGSWMVPREWISHRKFDAMIAAALRARHLIEAAEPS